MSQFTLSTNVKVNGQLAIVRSEFECWLDTPTEEFDQIVERFMRAVALVECMKKPLWRRALGWLFGGCR
ncbi:hypothetical protein [Sphingobium sp. MK2]|uniref:hypothetical protein n=1 Tax=Sphingobium sp. MK2 TaxID=3116540 RepID=UPI0032E35E72